MDPKIKFDINKLFGVIGYPIKQSLSPILHNWAFQKLSLPYVYLKWEIMPNKLGELMVAVRTLPISGLSVTIPFKEKIIPYLDELTDSASIIGAVNHVYWHEGKLFGNNTDVFGFIEPIKDLDIDSALVLGTGGAALACIYGLRKKGLTHIWVAGRKYERLKFLQKKFSIEPILWDKRHHIKAQLLVNCTPIGMIGHGQDTTPFSKEYLNNFSYVYDLVYNPIKTVLLRDSQDLGLVSVSGINMFIYQALYQFKTWTSYTFDVDKAYELLVSQLI